MNATAEQLTYEERVALCWRAGDLSWKLDEHQLDVYRKYRAFEAKPLTAAQNDNSKLRHGMHRIYVMDVGRRWGKTWLTLLIAIENCLRRKKCKATYATALKDDIGEIILPLLEEIADDCPEDVRPVYRGSSEGQRQHIWFPSSRSMLRLIGVDKNPNALRGKGSDFFAVSEAAYVKNLGDLVAAKVYSQFQRRPWARMILESSAPEELDHDFDTIFVPDAKERDAYHFATMWDNLAITEDERQEQYQGVAAISKAKADREFKGLRVRDDERHVIPEFSAEAHVAKSKRPNYAHAYVAGDPGGSKSFFALLWGYWDFEHARLVIERDWAKRNAGTYKVADVVRETELELWGTKHREPSHLRHERDRDTPAIDVDRAHRTVGGKLWRTPFQSFTYWEGDQFAPNPRKRITDVDERLVSDLNQDHELLFVNTTKDNLEAMCNVIRTAFKRGQIVIDPACVTLIEHLTHCRWDEKRVKWEMHKRYGHYDLVAALVYLWRNVDRAADPNPPAHWDKANVLMGTHPGHKDQHLSRSAGAQIANALGMQPGAGRTSWR